MKLKKKILAGILSGAILMSTGSTTRMRHRQTDAVLVAAQR